ncbi:hypothetical protein [Pseudomonas sp. SK2]|uniref:Imm43 family immunity protein n=1 Tax=Pseudomonas sp. SK2 TaxID=2841063 RepID=UPI00192BCCBC|nr:hypothetical protein [Pseudomonas sp. SK2]QQZ36328.1 hypothetical protein IF103_24625 [Pseudomonas sp. SK2]
MKYYMMSRKKAPGCPVGRLDATLYDKHYDDWGSVEHGYLPWYANSVRRRPHEKLPSGLVLVGRSKKYLFGVRQLIGDIYILSDSFFKACQQANVVLVDAEPVEFKVSEGSALNPLSYYAGLFESFSSKDVLEPASVVERDKYGRVKSFERLVISEGARAPVFKIKDFNSYVDTLFCNEEFRRRAEEQKIQGVEFLPLDEYGSASLDTI